MTEEIMHSKEYKIKFFDETLTANRKEVMEYGIKNYDYTGKTKELQAFCCNKSNLVLMIKVYSGEEMGVREFMPARSDPNAWEFKRYRYKKIYAKEK